LDSIFNSLLTHNVRILRPVRQIGSSRRIAYADYQDVFGEDQQVLIQPRSTRVDGTPLGPESDMTIFMYTKPTLYLQPDWVVQQTIASTSVAVAYSKGDTTLIVNNASSLNIGDKIIIGDTSADVANEHVIVDKSNNTLTVDPPLKEDGTAGTAVRILRRYIVSGIFRDVAGQGHHNKYRLIEPETVAFVG